MGSLESFKEKLEGGQLYYITQVSLMESKWEALTLSVARAGGKVFPEASSVQAAVMMHFLEALLGKKGSRFLHQ